MEIIVSLIYFMFFIIGTLLGSFFSLAIYRIPLHQNITHQRSYCPKCNHRLEFLDLIPVLSYICLGGKCRYCKEKIRGRYIYLEIFSGIIFLLFVLSVKINLYNIELQKLVYLMFGMFYISILFIIGGIEKENHNISKPVFLFGLIMETLYIIYLYIINVSIYKYVIYLFLMFLLIIANTILLKRKGIENYALQILELCMLLVIATNEQVVILSVILTLLLVAINQSIINSKNNKKKNIDEKINKVVPIGFYLCFTNIFLLIVQNFVELI